MPAVTSVALDWPVLQTNSFAEQSVPAVSEATHQPCARLKCPVQVSATTAVPRVAAGFCAVCNSQRHVFTLVDLLCKRRCLSIVCTKPYQMTICATYRKHGGNGSLHCCPEQRLRPEHVPRRIQQQAAAAALAAKFATCSGSCAHEHLECANCTSQMARQRVASRLGCSKWSAPVLVGVREAFWCQGMLECAASASKARRVLRHVSLMKLEALASRENSACSRSKADL